MAHGTGSRGTFSMPRAATRLAALTVSLMAGACAQLGDGDGQKFASSLEAQAEASTSNGPQTELEKATDYWGKEYAKNPGKLEAGLSYAKNLKALGQKRQALAVLQQVSLQNNSKELASEYGRLALELDQVNVAKKMLQIADDPANPDWRIISARGTAFAKEGAYGEAIPYYERALALAPDHPSILSNLALAYAMNGEAAKGEPMLRKAAAANGGNAKVRQNLALVLSLQGKYDEAKQIAGADLPPDRAAANAEFMRKLVKADPQASGPALADAASAPVTPPQLKPSASETAAAPASAWSTKVAATPAGQ